MNKLTRYTEKKIRNWLLCYNPNFTECDINIYVYGYFCLIELFLVLSFSIIVSIYFKNVITNLVFMITYILIRKLGGGWHSSTKARCTFISAIIILSANACIFGYGSLYKYLFTVSYIFSMLFSPRVHSKRHISKETVEKNKRLFRIISLILMIIFIATYMIGIKEIYLGVSYSYIFFAISLFIGMFLEQ